MAGIEFNKMNKEWVLHIGLNSDVINIHSLLI